MDIQELGRSLIKRYNDLYNYEYSERKFHEENSININDKNREKKN
jgi:hypothetical protein